MLRRSFLLASVAVLVAAAVPASATTLVTSLSAFRASAAGAVTATPNPGPYDLGQLDLPTTTTLALGDGSSLGLSAPAQVTQGGLSFPFTFSSGFAGEVFVPQNASGDQVSSITLTLGSGITALGFEIAPFSNAVGAPNFGVPGGPFSVTVTLSDGQTATTSLAGGSLDTGITPSQFFGFTGGGVSTLTISTSDRSGLGFGNFVDVATAVPEPASAALLLGGLAATVRGRRRAALA